MACTYAALILHDDGQDITGINLFILDEKMNALIAASGATVPKYWTRLFAKAIKGQDVSSFLNYGGSASLAPAS